MSNRDRESQRRQYKQLLKKLLRVRQASNVSFASSSAEKDSIAAAFDGGRAPVHGCCGEV
ncbi:MAG: hypothetical protein AB1586_02835 [Pseudomonadota bacterium]